MRRFGRVALVLSTLALGCGAEEPSPGIELDVGSPGLDATRDGDLAESTLPDTAAADSSVADSTVAPDGGADALDEDVSAEVEGNGEVGPDAGGGDALVEPVTCASSKDCPGDRVCAKDLGECVECAGDADCAGGTRCGGDHACHEVLACASDKDCKASDMVCDAGAAVCVECLGPADCAPGEACVATWCVPAVCSAGTTACVGTAVNACAPDGTGWSVVADCAPDGWCEDGACHPFVCTPGAVACAGEVLTVCAADGKSIATSKDCAAMGLHCFAGDCQVQACAPSAVECLDELTLGVCDAEGLAQTEQPCGPGAFCADGACLPAVCTPGAIGCAGSVVQTCNAVGSAWGAGPDCAEAGEKCVAGACVVSSCPAQATCIDDSTLGVCAADGVTWVEAPCPPQQACSGAKCVPQTCTPGTPMCDGVLATVCNLAGLGPAAGGTDCAAQGMTCQAGACQACTPDCATQQCWDGNAAKWDGCDGGKVVELQVAVATEDHQANPDVAAGSDRYLVVWEDGGKFTPTFDVRARVFGLDDEPLTGDVEITNGGGKETALSAAALTSGGFVVTWTADPGAGAAHVMAQRLTGDGAPSGPALQLDSSGCTACPGEVAPLPDGGFVVAWIGGDATAKGPVLAQIVGADGAKVGPPAYFDTGQGGPSVAPLADGGFVVAWQSGGAASFQHYGPGGTPAGEPVGVGEATAVARLARMGGSALALLVDTGPSALAFRRFELGGKLLGTTPIDLAKAAGAGSDLGVLTDGSVVTVWKQSVVRFQRFFATGAPASAPLLAATAGGTWGGRIAALPGSRFVLVWSADGLDGSGYGVYAQRFDADGGRLYH